MQANGIFVISNNSRIEYINDFPLSPVPPNTISKVTCYSSNHQPTLYSYGLFSTIGFVKGLSYIS